MTFASFTGLLNTLTSLSLAAFVFSKRPQQHTNQTYFFFGLTVALYSIGYFLWGLARSQAEALFAFKILTSGIILINSAYLEFVFSLLDSTRRKNTTLWACHLVNMFFIYATFYDLLFKTVVKKNIWGYWPVAENLFYIYFVFWLVQFLYGLLHLHSGYKNAAGQRSNQIKYVFISTLIGYLGGSTNWLPWFNVTLFPPHLNILVTVYVAILAYAILRHRLLGIDVVVKKTIVFAGIFLISYGSFAFISFLITDVLIKGSHDTEKVWIFALAASLLIFASAPLKNFMVSLTDHFLFQKKEGIKAILNRLSNTIITILDIEKAGKTILSTLRESLRLESGAIILADEHNKAYDILNSFNTTKKETKYASDDLFIQYLSQHGDIINLDNETAKKNLPAVVLAALQELNAVLCIPLYVHKVMIGILSLGKKKSDEEYTQEELDYLPTVASQVGIALSNARLFDEAIKSREKIEKMQLELIHREKMSFVSDLVKGIAHEVFNPLLPVFHKIEELEQDILVGFFDILKKKESVFDHDTRHQYLQLMNKLRSDIETLKINTRHIHLVIDTLNKMQKDDKETIGPLDFKTFFKDSRALIGMELHQVSHEIPIIEDIPRGLPPLKGNPTLLTQVFVNLFKNSIHAMNGKNAKKITVKADIDSEIAGFLKIEFSDTGSGIPADILPRIFDFRFTTKGPRGQGIGLNQCKLIIEKFGGSITCTSRAGVGTTFTICIPIWEGNILV